MLPFDCEVKQLRQLKCSAEEKERYRDLNGNVPCGKYALLIGKRKVDSQTEKKSLEELVKEDNAQKINQLLQKLTKGKALNEEEKQFYANWKKELKNTLENAG